MLEQVTLSLQTGTEPMLIPDPELEIFRYWAVPLAACVW